MRSIEQSIKVMVRIRPPSNCIIYRDENNLNVLHCGQKEHFLDHIFVAQDTNDDILQKVGYELVSNTLEGYNSTLFVYGHTGSGKTFTMNGSNSEEGLIYKTFKLLLKMLQNQVKYQFFTLKMSYFEIYNEEVKDLLGLNKINVRQKADKGFYLEGVQEFQLQSNDEFLGMFRKGMHNRKTDPTKMNSDSSRSHAIISFVVETTQIVNQSKVFKTSKMNFVDLAGSERLKQTEAIGQRKSEAANINKSLSVLKRVINMLSSNKSKQTNVVPYRESVLTMILKDSLGGNSHTIIIGTIHNNIKNPSNTSDILATLQFLQRAKKVKNQKKVNEKLQGNQERMKQKITQYQVQITSLKEEIQSLKSELQNAHQTIQVYSQEIKELKEIFIEKQTPIFQFVEQIEPYMSKIPFQNAKSYKDELSVIFQENNSFKSVKDTNQFKSCGEGNRQVYSQSLPSFNPDFDRRSGKSCLSVRRSQKSHHQKMLHLEVDLLQQKLQNFQQYQVQQQEILQLIKSNLNNLKFDEAQLNFLLSQHKKIQVLQNQIKRNQLYSQSLLTEFENEKNNLKKRYQGLQNISDRSSIILAQKKYNSTISNLQEKIQKLEQQKNNLTEESKVQLLKMEQQIHELISKNYSLQRKCQSQQNNYKRLQQCFQQSQKQQKEMDRLIEQHRVAMMQDNDFMDIVKQLKITNQEQQASLMTEINSLNDQIAQINQEKLELQLQLQHLKTLLSQKAKYIAQLKEQVQACQNKLNKIEQEYVLLEQYEEMKNHYLQNQEKLKVAKEILENFKDCLKVKVYNSQMTISELLSQYILKEKKVQQLQQTNSSQSKKIVDLQANLQIQKCRLNTFNHIYKQNIEEQGKKMAQKDEEIEFLKQKLERLSTKVQRKQRQLEQASELFQVKATKSKLQEQQLYNSFLTLQGQNNFLKEINHQITQKLQNLESLQNEKQKQYNERERVLKQNQQSLVCENEKLKKKSNELRTQTLRYSEWMMKQIEQFNNGSVAKRYQIKKLKKDNQNLQNEIKRLKAYVQKQGKNEEIKKILQQSTKNQKRINELQNRLKSILLEKAQHEELIRSYNFKINQLTQELMKIRCQYQDQKQRHLVELNSIRSQNLNSLLQKQKAKLSGLYNKPEKKDKRTIDNGFIV